MTMMKQIQIVNDRKGTVEKYKYLDLAMETAFEYKYRIAMETAFEYKYRIATETAEQNTSKQFSTKETALRNVYKYSRIIGFFFFFETE